eukprot:3767281-Rhodomonas_salina.2
MARTPVEKVLVACTFFTGAATGCLGRNSRQCTCRRVTCCNASLFRAGESADPYIGRTLFVQ